MIIKEIFCINKNNNGVIESLKYINICSDEKKNIIKRFTAKEIKKTDFIMLVRDEEKTNKIKIITDKSIEVHIINNLYLRTDGDKSKNNDLLNLCECKFRFK